MVKLINSNREYFLGTKRRMKYHKWESKGERVECIRCGVSVVKKARPRRVTACPPTWFERSIIDRLWYGGSAGDSFKGFHSLLRG